MDLMKMKKSIEQQKELYDKILEFIDNENSEEENQNEFNNLKQMLIIFIKSVFIENEKASLKELLLMIIKIAKNHNRKNNFLCKIRNILKFLKDKIKQNFTNSELFFLSKKCKMVLLIFIEEEIIVVDKSLIDLLKNEDEKISKYSYFFYIEIKKVTNEKIKVIEEMFFQYKPEFVDQEFNEIRKIGENNSYISQLIRQDSVEEFVAHINRKNISPSSLIKPSIFETNSFLINKNPSLIEYAAFFGSFQILQHLIFRGAKFNSSLWLYAIHGRNPDIIHLLEENKIEPKDKTYAKCFKESIKCHHNDIAEYIKNNKLKESSIEKEEKEEEEGEEGEEEDKENEPEIEKENLYSYRYHNYHFLSVEINENDLYYLCKYGYFNIVKFLIPSEKIKINRYRISKQYI